jgi:hypothetical protein
LSTTVKDDTAASRVAPGESMLTEDTAHGEARVELPLTGMTCAADRKSVV